MSSLTKSSGVFLQGDSNQESRRQRSFPVSWEAALLAVAYWLTAYLALSLAIPSGFASPVWPAAGIAFAFIFVYGYRLWPSILLGSVSATLAAYWDANSLATFAQSAIVATSIGLAASLQAVVGVFLVKRYVGDRCTLIDGRETWRFLVFAGPLSCLIGATCSVSSLVIAGFTAGADFGYSWWTWWGGDTIGVLIAAPLTFVWIGSPKAIWQNRRWSVTLSLSLALLAIIAALVFARSREEQRLQLSFQKQANVAVNAIDSSLVKYEEILQSIRSLYASSENVRRQDFRSFVSRTLARVPGIQALSWNPVISDEQRDELERGAREDGFSNFRITERNAQGHLVPAGNREEYVAVYYIEPYEGNESALGFDVTSDPTRLEALHAARDSGRPTATAPITLVQETGTQAATLMTIPIYASAEAPENIEDRRSSLLGYAVGVLRIGDLVTAALDGIDLKHTHVRLHDDSSGGQLLAEYPSAPDAEAARKLRDSSHDRLRFTVGHPVAGRDWRLVLAPSHNYAAANRIWSTWMMLAGGLLLASLVGAFQLVLSGRNALDIQRARAISRINKVLNDEVAERERAERALLNEKERVQVTLHSIGDAVITTNATGRVEYLNPIAERLTGWCLEEAQGRHLHAVFLLVDEETRRPLSNPLRQCLEESRPLSHSQKSLMIDRCGREYAIQGSVAPIRDDAGNTLGVVVVFNDVTESRRLAREAAHNASHDTLTGLMNRREFERRLEGALASSKEYDVQHALCYLDLDQFKVVNDTAGHVAGDELLKHVTSLLSQEVRDSDSLARLGGDEFGLLLSNCPLEKAVEIAERLVVEVRDFRFVWNEQPFEVGVSIGITPIHRDMASTAELLSQADVACYAAKDEGRNRVHVYSTDSAGTHFRHNELKLAADMRTALEQDRFRLFCQPIVPLTAPDDRQPRYELLLRLVDEENRIVLPGTFIPGAERYELMNRVDRWVVQTAFQRCAQGLTPLRGAKIAINLSGNTLNDELFLEFVRAQFHKHDIEPESICFEITETAAVKNLSGAQQTITALREIGCEFALDDFGSGFSSFSYLRNLPVDYLKIDGSFVRSIATDAKDRAMVSAINQVAHTMEIKTIAEWVETEDTMRELRKLGVDYVQGYAVGRPEPLDQVA